MNSTENFNTNLINYLDDNSFENIENLNEEEQQKEDKIIKYINSLKDDFNNLKNFFYFPIDIFICDNELLNFILNKKFHSLEDIYYLSFYITKNFQNFMNLIYYYRKTNEECALKILFKIIKYLTYEKLDKNKIIYRIGEKGKNFYIVKEGKLNILMKYNYNITMTKENYLQHLKNLYSLNEHILFNNTYIANIKNNIQWELPGIIKDFISEYCKEDKKNFDDNNFNLDEYLNQIQSTIIESSYGFNVTIFNYVKMRCLEKGEFFGEDSLRKNNNINNYFIITKEKTELFIISNELFYLTLKVPVRFFRKKKYGTLLSCEIMKGIKSNKLKKIYLELFREFILNKGDFLFKKGEKKKEIFLIKNGEIEINTKVNFNEFNEIIVNLGGKKKEIFLDDHKFIIFLNNYINKKKDIKIYVSNDNDILGLGDVVDNNDFYTCNAKVITNNCKVFSIDINLLNNIMNNEKIVEINVKKFSENKKNFFLNLLNNIRENFINKFYNLLEIKSNFLKIQEKNINKDNNNLLNKKNKSLKKILVFNNLENISKKNLFSIENIKSKSLSIINTNNNLNNNNIKNLIKKETINKDNSFKSLKISKSNINLMNNNNLNIMKRTFNDFLNIKNNTQLSKFNNVSNEKILNSNSKFDNIYSYREKNKRILLNLMIKDSKLNIKRNILREENNKVKDYFYDNVCSNTNSKEKILNKFCKCQSEKNLKKNKIYTNFDPLIFDKIVEDIERPKFKNKKNIKKYSINNTIKNHFNHYLTSKSKNKKKIKFQFN